MNNKQLTLILLALFVILMSLPWLVPHMGFTALFGLFPLLAAERIASETHIKRFFLYHYGAFVAWNAATTFWVCNATVGGGIAAIMLNALQMSLVFGLFRISRKRLKGFLPYVFLMCAWIAWERFYYGAEISWPWLVLGGAFARTTSLVQWYSLTGTLGGSLWIWAVNLALFAILVSLSDGNWVMKSRRSQAFTLASGLILLLGPIAASETMYFNFGEKSEGRVDVLIGQPNFDPYHKFESMTQSQQNAVLLSLFEKEDTPDLYIAPETFTSDIVLGDLENSATWRAFSKFVGEREGATMLLGASTYEIFRQRSCPNILARPFGDGWILNHNSAMTLSGSGKTEIYHKSRLVPGVEKTPYPRLFNKIDEALGGVMGRCVPQKEAAVLHCCDSVPFGCAICYESIYGEYCTEYVKRGARFLTVITNDAWWGDTPGYKQHFSYSRLRAIETRRDLARCGNTGISAIINQRGDIVKKGGWWTEETLRGEINLNSVMTPFVRYGDVAGKVCILGFLLLLLLLLTTPFRQKRVG